MTRIYLIRHAEAEGNLYRIAHGQYDSILTDKGWKQVAALEKRFEDKIVDAVYSSDLYRAMATATAIFKPRGLQLQPMTQLREICMGRWEGMPWAHLNRDDAEMMCHFNHQPELYQVEGGETFLQVQQRMVAAIRQIAAAHDGQSVAIISHGAAIRTVLAAAQNMSINEMAKLPYGENTAVSLLEVSGDKIHPVFMNSANHLDADKLQTLTGQRWAQKEAGGVERGLYFEPMDLQEDGERYLFCRAEYLKSLYGHLEGFDGVGYLQEAMGLQEKYPGSVLKTSVDGEMAGMLQLYPGMGVEDGVGYIDFYYMLPPFRSQGLGGQMLGQATAFYRQLGRDKLRLFCPESNTKALNFFEKYGFGRAGQLPDGRLILQKFIGYRPLV